MCLKFRESDLKCNTSYIPYKRTAVDLATVTNVRAIFVEVLDFVPSHAHFTPPLLIADVHADAVDGLYFAVALPASLHEFGLVAFVLAFRRSA